MADGGEGEEKQLIWVTPLPPQAKQFRKNHLTAFWVFQFLGEVCYIGQLLTHEPMKVPWCFICQKNSCDGQITWLAGYIIASTYEDSIP